MTVLHCRGKSQTQETPDGGKKEKCRISCKGKSVFMFQDKIVQYLITWIKQVELTMDKVSLIKHTVEPPLTDTSRKRAPPISEH